MIARTAKLISIAFFLLFVQGCRIALVVPEGGTIVSTSGNNNCTAIGTCFIDLPNIPFDGDTFTAFPDEGYVFKGWSSQEGRPNFCSGETDPCVIPAMETNLTRFEIDAFLEPIFEEFELLDLLPATTRGVFQIYPDAPGALDTTVSTAPWSLGPLTLIEKYSAGMDIVGTAGKIMLAQMAGTPDEFILLAELDTSDVATLAASVTLVAISDYQGQPRWEITGTDLELTEINSQTLAIASHTTLEQALDTYAGAADNIELGPLASYVGALAFGTALPNSFIYALPALYGAVPAPGSGDTSLSQAEVVLSAFGVNAGTLSGVVNFYSDNALTYRTKLMEQLVDLPTPKIFTQGNTSSVSLTGLSVDDDIRPLLKTLILDMDGVDYASAVSHPTYQPFLNFLVGEDPNSIFINFEFTDQQARDDFTADHLPTGFTLAPIRIIEGETPRYFLVLNMYQSGGGLVSGARAEWSVFVNDPETNDPRFLVVQAVADSITADSVHLLVLTPEPVTHTLTPSAIESYVGEVVDEVESEIFSSTINWPQSPQTLIAFEREFVVANDYIFWGNGVADRGLYNSTVFNREAVLVDTVSQFSFAHSAEWASYVDPAPVHALVYLNPLEIVVSPWWNLDETYLDGIIGDDLIPVPFPTRTELLNFKNGFYPGLVQGNAQAAIRGEGLALSSTTISDAVPTASYHFPLLDASGLLTEVAGPGIYTPVAIALFDGEAAGHYLTLKVYQREGDPCGIRAEWITYVEGADGRPDGLRIDALAAEPCLDPISLMTVAANVTQSHNLVSNAVDTQIISPFVHFEGSVDLDSTTGAQAGLDFLESGDRICSVNDVCDEFYIEGQILIEDAEQADSLAVQIDAMTTPWDSYIDPGAVRAGVRLTPALLALNPWRNMRSFAAPAPVP